MDWNSIPFWDGILKITHVITKLINKSITARTEMITYEMKISCINLREENTWSQSMSPFHHEGKIKRSWSYSRSQKRNVARGGGPYSLFCACEPAAQLSLQCNLDWSFPDLSLIKSVCMPYHLQQDVSLTPCFFIHLCLCINHCRCH